jgi:nucleotide-binding universal stress UspA family protein
MLVTQQRGSRETGAPRTSPGRPVMLATLDVPFDHDAVVFAVDSAVELGERLIIANVVERPPLPLSVMLGYEDLPYTPEMAESLAEPVRLAQSLGVNVTRLRVKSLHPVAALIEAVGEQDPGILVFGPDRRRIMRLRYWRAARAIRASVTTLVWMADGPLRRHPG